MTGEQPDQQGIGLAAVRQVATLMAARVALVTVSVFPDLVVSTTRSPPRTGRPS